MRAPGTLLAIASVAAAAALIGAGLSAAAPSSGSGPHLDWAMARSSLEHVSSTDPAQAERSFDAPSTLVQNDSPLRSDPTPTGWSATSTARWGSFAQFSSDVAAGLVPSYVKVVHYDNENWSQTPLREQLDPADFEREFCSLAHQNGWGCYTGPAQDLCGVLSSGETYAHCYLGLDLAGGAARHADVIDIQAQALETRGARVYGNFVRRAATQARAANPDVVVLGNLAPSPNGQGVPSAELYRCAKAALPYVSGFYTTVGVDEGPTMVEVLRLLEP